ncbi:MAG: proline dehydrogenase, partial [candidate division Zixibacteria bacterium]|nr:proline dehydrogenase [candidate division Zixibacteria bacterium]
MSGILSFISKRFVAGEDFDQALNAVRSLNSRKISTTLDILGENVSNQEEAKAKADAYLNVVDGINKSGVESHVSLKLTQMGLDVSDDFCFENVSRIFERAKQYNNFVRVDMEGSGYAERTLQLVYRWHELYPNMGTVIQAMLHRSISDILELNRRKIRVRLCKGAYKEPPIVAIQEKKHVNENFVKLMQML